VIPAREIVDWIEEDGDVLNGPRDVEAGSIFDMEERLGDRRTGVNARPVALRTVKAAPAHSCKFTPATPVGPRAKSIGDMAHGFTAS